MVKFINPKIKFNQNKKRLNNKKLFNQKRLNIGVVSTKLTTAEQEVLYLISKEFLTAKKISIRRGKSFQSTYKLINSLKKKGALNIVNQMVEKKRCTIQPFKYYPPNIQPKIYKPQHQIQPKIYKLQHQIQPKIYKPQTQIQPKIYKPQNQIQPNRQIRLHGQEFNIKIIYKDDKYKYLLDRINTTKIDDNTIRLYKNSIEVYSGKSFYADNAQKATADSIDYWNRFFARLENEFKVILIKPRAQNIKLVKNHYAEINNELAIECEKKGDKINIYAREDGKLWFSIDNSFNLKEAETQHSSTAKADMEEVVQPFFNDLRDNAPPVSSDLAKFIADTQRQLQELVQAQINTQGQFQTILRLLTPAEAKEEEKNIKRPDYFG